MIGKCRGCPRGRRDRTGSAVARLSGAALLLAAAPLWATHPLPGPHFLHCEVRGGTVVLTWDMLGISPDLHEAKLYRDDALLASLAPDALSEATKF